MTPQDKAKELVEKYTFSCRECDNAKQCALICANEIIIQIESSTPKDDPYANLFAFDYWNEVKTEIEKM